MDAVRYYLALILWMSVLPAVASWFIIHPFIGTWRRLGPRVAYSIVAILVFLSMAALFAARKPALSIEFGFNPWLTAVGAISYLASGYFEVMCRRHLKARTLIGVPEVAPRPENQKLLQEGIYARVRHPRYVSVILGTLGFALFTNYLAMYVCFPIWVGALYLVILLEERELVERFGDSYRDYQVRVPRFIPRLAGRPSARP